MYEWRCRWLNAGKWDDDDDDEEDDDKDSKEEKRVFGIANQIVEGQESESKLQISKPSVGVLGR